LVNDEADFDSDSVDDNGDSGDDDFHRYKEILYSIGEFARCNLDNSLAILAK
jgi:hypothetical protein